VPVGRRAVFLIEFTIQKYKIKVKQPAKF